MTPDGEPSGWTNADTAQVAARQELTGEPMPKRDAPYVVGQRRIEAVLGWPISDAEADRVTQVFSDCAMHVALGALSGEAEILAAMDRLKRAGAEGDPDREWHPSDR